MSETNATADAAQAPEAPATETAAPETPAEQSSGSLDALPEEFAWVRDEISKLRNEAAKYRTRAREFADDATYHAAKAAVERIAVVEDEKADALARADELEKELSAQRVVNARLQAAVRHGLSSEALEFLTGETEEEIEDRAKRLAEMMARPERRPDPSQGSTAGGGRPTSPSEAFATAIESWLS